MSIKALYVGECHSFIDKTLAQAKQIHTQIKNIQKSIEGIIALEEAFKGKTANSIRTFYKEVHQPFLLFLEGFIDNYSDTLREIRQSIDELEPDRNGVIREDFLTGGVQRGLKRAEHMAIMLTDEANAVLRSVKDIIDVRDLDDGEFLDKVQHAKKMTHQTIEKLYLFDRHNTAKLEPVEQDLHTMKNYVSRIRELGNSGQINIATYQARKIADQKIHQQLMQGLRKKAGKNAIDLEVIMGELGKRLFSKFIPLAAIPINYLQKHFGLKTMDYSYRAMCAILAAMGDSLTASEFSTIEHLVVSKVKVSDYKGVKQGIYYTLADGRIVRKFESETGINYELVRTIPANRHKPKEPEKSWIEKAADGVKDTFVKAGEFGAVAVKETADFLILDDVKTVMNPEASKVDRIIAGASIFPVGKPLKLIKAGGTIKFANKGKHTAKRVKVKVTSKGITKVKYGDQYTRIDRKKVLKPDVEYTSKEGYNYKTDGRGRINSAEGTLKLGDSKRNNYAQKVVGREDRKPDDEGGHLIASIFKGSGDIDNLVPMNGNLNKGEWKKLENTWADALKHGDEVKVKITPNYKANSQRPESFNIKYKIGDDEWEIRRFNNVPGGKVR